MKNANQPLTPEQKQIRELELIVSSLEASNKLLSFRLGVVLEQNQDLIKENTSLKQEVESEKPKKPKNNK